MQNELKPCPKCNRKPKVECNVFLFGNDFYYSCTIQCKPFGRKTHLKVVENASSRERAYEFAANEWTEGLTMQNDMKDRLIDLLINADVYDSYECKLCTKEDYCDYCNAEKLADHLIANDIVPVVRCKDCKYYETHRPSVTLNCERDGRLIPMMPDDYCSYGERE